MSKADTTNEAAFTQYATCGPEAATIAPPMSGPAAQVTFSTVWRSALPGSRSSSSRRFGRPAFTAGLKRPFARPVAAPSATIAADDPTKGRAQNTPARARSAPIISRRRCSLSSSGPSVSPTPTVGRNSEISSAPTQVPECVESQRSTVSAIVASHDPSSEPSVARNSNRNPGFRRRSPRCPTEGSGPYCVAAAADTARSSASARKAFSSAVPIVTRIAVSEPNALSGRTITPSRNSASKTARASEPVSA